VYSLNAPVPGRVAALAADLFPELVGFESIREEHSVLLKRLGDDEFSHLAERVRQELRGAPAVEARITGIDYFESPPRGSSPVVYLTVESPGLQQLHERLVDAFGAIDGLEGENYVMHVTLARGGGDIEAARALVEREIEPITWTITELRLWDAKHGEAARTIPLPA